jgi:hypothetical protein
VNQPQWRLIAALGDADPLTHGGHWVFADETGVYPPEAERYDPETGLAHRYCLEPHTLTEGVLSDNRFHPECATWYADRLAGVASWAGTTVTELRQQFCSPDPVQRAHAYAALAEFFGLREFDSYPLTLTPKEAAIRYKTSTSAGKGESCAR